MIGVSDNDLMTRKEYIKKKKNSRKKFPHITPIFTTIVIILLSIYLVKQLNVYNKVTALTNKVIEESALIKTYKIYFMSDSYTSSKDKILYLYTALDESRHEIPNGLNFSKIQVDSNYIYGIKDANLYRIDRVTEEIYTICEGNVYDYLLTSNGIYVYKYLENNDEITGLYKVGDEIRKVIPSRIYQMLSDNTNLYIVKQGTTSKTLYKYDMDGGKGTPLTDKEIVSYMIQDEKNIFFANKSDNGKIYKVTKNGGKALQLSSKSVFMDSEEMYSNGNRFMAVYGDSVIYVNKEDESKVYMVKNDSTDERIVIDNSVAILQLRNNQLYFRLNNDISIYRYNIATSEVNKITSARTYEMICIN